jgi:hypothetical protein
MNLPRVASFGEEVDDDKEKWFRMFTRSKKIPEEDEY